VQQSRDTDRIVKFVINDAEGSSRGNGDNHSKRRLMVYKFLRLVYRRESFGGVPGLFHRLNADLESIKASRKRLAPRYTNNKYWPAEGSWNTYGLYALNSVLWTHRWGVEYPPEVACDSVVSTLMYLRAARAKMVKLQGDISCIERDAEGNKVKVDGKYKRYTHHHDKVTWWTLHRATSSGKLCPGGEGSRWHKGFIRRARAQGLNPDGRPRLNDFGTEPTRESQDAYVSELWGKLNG
jgi:hypothetical protein